MLSCEFCKISKNTFLHRTPLVVTSVFRKNVFKRNMIEYKKQVLRTHKKEFKNSTKNTSVPYTSTGSIRKHPSKEQSIDKLNLL